MQPAHGHSGPAVTEIERIVAMRDPVLRNCEITQAYHELAAAFTARVGIGWSNWLTVATWASRQAGDVIRGEQGWIVLRRHVALPVSFAHPIESLWRKLLQRGLLSPETRLGRIVRAIPGPLDAVEAAAEQVALGNVSVFDEIATAFARWLAAEDREAFLASLRPGEPPEGQEHLRRSFRHYYRLLDETDARRRAELAFRADLEIAWQEQARLQEVIRASMEQPVVRAHALGLRVLAVVAPEWRLARDQVALLLGALVAPLHRFGLRVARRVITELLMTLRLPDGSVLRLGSTLQAPAAESLRVIQDAELREVLTQIACTAHDDACGTDDWSDFQERMHYIAHLFRAYRDEAAFFARSPFTVEQVARFRAGVLPEGRL
jgi:hypothetical protein